MVQQHGLAPSGAVEVRENFGQDRVRIEATGDCATSWSRNLGHKTLPPVKKQQP